MREIKFRAWDKTNKKMFVFDTIRICEEYNLLGFHWEGNHNYADLDIDEDNFEIMQYTGLKDRTGKEVYEGDIIQIERLYKGQKTIFECKWNSKYAGWEHYGGTVIGNIYENPELLEVKQ